LFEAAVADFKIMSKQINI